MNGKKVASLQAGSYFGEQALLHNTKRNATVIARGPVTCATTDYETFNNLIRNIGESLEEGR